jgi:hypothetical protein
MAKAEMQMAPLGQPQAVFFTVLLEKAGLFRFAEQTHNL